MYATTIEDRTVVPQMNLLSFREKVDLQIFIRQCYDIIGIGKVYLECFFENL